MRLLFNLPMSVNMFYRTECRFVRYSKILISVLFNMIKSGDNWLINKTRNGAINYLDKVLFFINNIIIFERFKFYTNYFHQSF